MHDTMTAASDGHAALVRALSFLTGHVFNSRSGCRLLCRPFRRDYAGVQGGIAPSVLASVVIEIGSLLGSSKLRHIVVGSPRMAR